MTKGWYGKRQQHSMASKGIKSKIKSMGYAYDENVVELAENKIYRLKIINDPNPQSPREWDNFGHMVCWHNRYSLGDEQPRDSAQEWMDELKEQYGNKVEILPLYLYDHSGITMNTSGFSHMGMHGYFDSGQVGWIYVTHDEIKKEFGKVTKETKQHALRILSSEVDIYDDYIRGNVYGFALEKKKQCKSCEHDEWELIDSVYGFYGDYRDNKSGMRDNIPKEGIKLFDKMVG